MTNSKRSEPRFQDRLSELPDSVIFHIFWFVPMIDVVRTTILSKRWRNFWTNTPFLNFENCALSRRKIDKLRNFVNRALLRWNGIKILKFKLDSYCAMVDDIIYGDSELWVNFAKDKGVEELYLHINGIYYFLGIGQDKYVVPQCLYSCSSLKALSIKVCTFKINGNVQWNQLKCLTITGCFGVTKHVINQILSGSPRLEVLNLSFVDYGENLDIRSDSLKGLLICKSLFDYEGMSLVSELRVDAPNLETLIIKSFPYTNCRLVNVSSLTYATIGFYGQMYGCNDCDFTVMDDIESCIGFLSFQDYVGDNFSQILQTIQHVESVTLSYCCLKVLRAMKTRCMHSSFPNVKSLEIRCCFDNFEQLVGLLEIFPQLESLVLRGKKVGYCRDDPKPVKFDAKSYLNFEVNLPKSFLLQLKTVDLTWAKGENIFPFVEILLKYASKLEELVFQVKKVKPASPPSNDLLWASQKLLRMPKSSPNCTILTL